MKSFPLLTAAAVMALAATAAEAQPGRHGHGGPGAHGGPGGQGGPAQALMMLRAADANGDNTITLGEVQDLQAEVFAYMDRNGDGFLDLQDANPVRQRLHAIAEAEGGERRHRRGRHGGRGPGRMDADQDGRVSYAEFTGRENRVFERLDVNSDGQITPDELDAAVERRENRGMWWRD